MGAPLTSQLAEIRVAEVESQALTTSPDPPHSYCHFIDDGLGASRDHNQADTFLTFINSLTQDLTFTIEHPTLDGTIPFLDVLIHPDKSTSIYRKPTHTNLYTRYNSCTTTSSKVIRSLTRRAYRICSLQHLNHELRTIRHICLTNGFPPHRVSLIMDQVHRQAFACIMNIITTSVSCNLLDVTCFVVLLTNIFIISYFGHR
jgi:hypothetical protein